MNPVREALDYYRKLNEAAKENVNRSPRPSAAAELPAPISPADDVIIDAETSSSGENQDRQQQQQQQQSDDPLTPISSNSIDGEKCAR